MEKTVIKTKRKTTVREDILSYLNSNSNVKNPFDIAKAKHRHIASIRRELRAMSKDGLINLEIDGQSKQYTSIELKSATPFPTIGDTPKVLGYNGSNTYEQPKKENFFVKFLRKIF